MLHARLTPTTRNLVHKLSLTTNIAFASLSCSVKRPLSTAAGKMARSLPKDPLVWIDCEMTGLDLSKDRILEIAVIVTDGDLNPVDEGIEYVIKTDKNVLDSMGDWCRRQHEESGLTEACLKSPHAHDTVRRAVMDYIKKWIPRQRAGVLAGNSVHVDRVFLVQEMPEVVDWLHYRIVDVSSVKELCRRWYPSQVLQKKNDDHRALDDIRASINELGWYRERIFVLPDSEDR
ncbi:ribonuclease H-like protein [Thelephora ganbajun]|uniref:Ribonuclease H-like protein n=1 Tax=Thelephora ganbajun TaxID=370292 RepID=A0ACB6ZSQ0_THEGA|nr:ribonuclease H-like protein [Thelephora ganbajun]